MFPSDGESFELVEQGEGLLHDAAEPAYAWALLSLYAVMPLNAVPRMIDAPSGVVMACTGLDFGFVVVAATCFLHAERTYRRVNPRAES